MRKNKQILLLMCVCLAALCGCTTPATDSFLGNDCINRTNGPYIVGATMEFAYAMWLPKGAGRLTNASVEASFAGDSGTYLENKAYHVDDQGQDLGITVGNKCVTNGAITTVNFTIDTCATTLRYYYVVPSAARDKEISFNFKAEADNGESVAFVVKDCKVRKMDMVLNKTISAEKPFFSLETMTAYSKSEAEFMKIPVDLVWAYIPIENASVGSCYLSPARVHSCILAPYLTSITLPDTELRDTRKLLANTVGDSQLSTNEYQGEYIDDEDFKTIDISHEVDFVKDITTRRGFWCETADGKYRAYIYCNQMVSDTETIISIKRYAL